MKNIRKIIVKLEDRSYPIYIGKNALSDKSLLGKINVNNFALVTNKKIKSLHLSKIKNNSIKEDSTWEKKYPPFVINKCLSMFYDCIAQANEMNGYHFLDKKVQFHFYINSIRKKKRFGGKWLSQAKLKNLEYVKEYYGYSNEKARDVLPLLSNANLNTIKGRIQHGGQQR